MDFSNDGASIYHRSLAVYIRRDGDLIRCHGKNCQWVSSSWPTIRTTVLKGSSEPLHQSKSHALSRLEMSDPDPEIGNLEIYEIQKQNQNEVAGLILKKMSRKSSMDFDKFFSALILTQMQLGSLKSSAENNSVTQAIVDLFDKQLRYQVPNDQWEIKGREYFTSKVRYYTSRNLRLELCLPAFPCKSSNPEKVATTLPDKGEEIALRRLHEFAQKVETIYKPGAQVWIISDGHVFSDCIGVDDQTVDDYGAHLKTLNNAISSSFKGPRDRVRFRSLVDMFDLDVSDVPSYEKLGIPNLNHHIATTLKDDAELCRRILMAGCQPNEAGLRARINSQDASILALYRGFSRFMLEDLDLHPLTQALSRSQRKKLATKVSFEMILRNQAYSNLVELMCPDHVRLSIHAHNNSGPKFGIRLFDTKIYRATHSLDKGDGEASSADLLHIPTPWHNCVATFPGEPVSYVTKSKAITDALSTPRYTGAWVEGDLAEGKGGFYSLYRPVPPPAPAPAPKQASKEELERVVVRQDKPLEAISVRGSGMARKTVRSMVLNIPLAIYNLCINSLRFSRAWLMAYVSQSH
ncbi:hypothetical protein LOZ44_006703 [Ophidiomyces ophidiicola]|nr:hypothetical protein LOZ44_006703 [Ophidiomyces ophidiicola]